jgi:hypothetical protein
VKRTLQSLAAQTALHQQHQPPCSLFGTPCSVQAAPNLLAQHPSSPDPLTGKPGWWRPLALSQMPPQHQPAYRPGEVVILPLLPDNLHPVWAEEANQQALSNNPADWPRMPWTTVEAQNRAWAGREVPMELLLQAP